MTKTRREFSPEFKREAVALLESSGRPQMQIAAELGIQPSMLRSWRAAQNKVPSGAGAGQAATTGLAGPSPADLASENAKLRRELERTRMERDVLRKPSASSRRCRGEVRLY
jgi:transposase